MQTTRASKRKRRKAGFRLLQIPHRVFALDQILLNVDRGYRRGAVFRLKEEKAVAVIRSARSIIAKSDKDFRPTIPAPVRDRQGNRTRMQAKQTKKAAQQGFISHADPAFA